MTFDPKVRIPENLFFTFLVSNIIDKRIVLQFRECKILSFKTTFREPFQLLLTNVSQKLLVKMTTATATLFPPK